jgi:hypothetical protein
MTSSPPLRALTLILVLLPASTLAATGCPPGPDRISVEVRASVSFDATSGRYTYSYAVANSAASAQDVDTVGVDVIPPVSTIRAPAGWAGAELSIRPRVEWNAVAVADPDAIVESGAVPPSTAQIPPGAAARGFSFQSPLPPGVGAFRAGGYFQLPAASAANEAEAERMAEELVEACPEFARPSVDQGIAGRTIVPVRATPVRIDVKPGEAPNSVNPGSNGVIPVAILGTASLDVRKVDAASVRLGVGQVSSRSGGHLEDVNGDGRPDLVFQFPTQGTQLRCGDTVLVLTGQTIDGVVISGFDAVVTPGCR